MEDPNSTLLPYILETLSRKPELCDTFDHICKEIEEQLMADNNMRYGDVRTALQRALSVGQSLGIITLTNETIRMPFNFRARPAPNYKIVSNTPNQQIQQPAVGPRTPVGQNTNDANSVPTRPPYPKHNGTKLRREDPDLMFGPPPRGPRRVRGRPRGRSCMRRTKARSYSRGKSGRSGKRARSGYVRRYSRRR